MIAVSDYVFHSCLLTVEGSASPSSTTSFVLGVFASVVGGIIIIGLTKWRLKKLVRYISGSSLFGHGVECVYKNQRAALKDMINDFNKSDFVDVLCVRGYSISQREQPFHFLLTVPNKVVRIILANPGNADNPNAFLASRASEYGPDPSLYRQYITTSIREVIAAASVNHNVHCRLHREPPVFRAYICKKRTFLSFFMPGIPATEAPILSIKNDSTLYNGMARYFSKIWESSPAAESEIGG